MDLAKVFVSPASSKLYSSISSCSIQSGSSDNARPYSLRVFDVEGIFVNVLSALGYYFPEKGEECESVDGAWAMRGPEHRH